MTEATAAAPASEPQETQPQQPPAPTHEEMVATIRKAQERDFDKHDREERLKKLIRKSSCGQPWNNPLFGAYNPSLEYTLEELKILVPLERDRLSYNWVKKNEAGEVITEGCLSVNKYGLYSVPRPHGRLKPHMNHRQQAIKSAAIRVFRKLVEETSASLRATCKEEQIEYLGLPDAMIPELGAKAMRIAVREVTATRKYYTRKNRRQQEFARRTNAGLEQKSASAKRYINRGEQYGK
jgi:hypothetical protein